MGGKPAPGYALRRFPAHDEKRTFHLLHNRTFLFALDRLFAKRRNARMLFPITTGVADLGGPKAEIAHSGGLALSAHGTRVELSSFLIDVTGGAPRLTGVVVANDNVVARIPLFDLSLASSAVNAGDSWLRIGDVAVTLSKEAAAALNDAFNLKTSVS